MNSNKKLWSGRFKKPINPKVEKFNASISFDKRLYAYDIEGSIAHAAMLGKQNIISKEESIELIKGLEELKKDISNDHIIFSEQAEDIHMNIEILLLERIGEVAKKLHTARSRNDQVALDIRLFLKDEIKQIMILIQNLIKSLEVIAKEHSNTIMPGYTHLQKAQNITLAMHLEAYVSMFTRDIERLKDCLKRMNYSPLGAGALAGTSLSIDRYFVAKKLKFSGIIENTIDAVSDRDFAIEFAGSSSIIMMHLSRLCEELVLWATEEFSFITLDDGFATGSSLMPNKKNPDVPELIRGKTGKVYGQLIALLTIMKALPLAYNKDMQEDKETIFTIVDTLQACLSILPDFLKSLKFETNNMKKSAENSYAGATLLVDRLVKEEVAFREAHEIIGKLIAYCIENNKKLIDLEDTELTQFLH